MTFETASSEPSLSNRCKVAEFINGSMEDGTRTNLSEILAPRSYHIEVELPAYANRADARRGRGCG
jgi:hypothetical protein